MLTALDALDFSPLFDLLALAGAVLCLYVMQKSWHDEVLRIDPPTLRWLRRGARTAISLTLCWAVIFFNETGTRAPLPLVLLVLALDLQLAERAATLLWRSTAFRHADRRLPHAATQHFQNHRRIG